MSMGAHRPGRDRCGLTTGRITRDNTWERNETTNPLPASSRFPRVGAPGDSKPGHATGAGVLKALAWLADDHSQSFADLATFYCSEDDPDGGQADESQTGRHMCRLLS